MTKKLYRKRLPKVIRIVENNKKFNNIDDNSEEGEINGDKEEGEIDPNEAETPIKKIKKIRRRTFIQILMIC